MWIFLWKCFVLSYVNELCIYPRLCLQVGSPKTQNPLDKPVCFTRANVLLSYVNETVLAWNQAFLQDSWSIILSSGQLTLCQCYLKMHVVGKGSGAILWVLRHFLSLISKLLVAYIIRLKTSRGHSFCSLWCLCQNLYLFYTLIILYFTKALSDQASSLAPDWILLLWRPRIEESFMAQRQSFKGLEQAKCSNF